MKKIVPILILGMLVIGGLEAVAVPFHDSQNIVQTWKVQPPKALSAGDELDQSQLLMNWFGPVGRSSAWANLYYVVAQSFTPTKDLLTRVQILIARNNSTTHDFTLALHDNLTHASLASVNVPASQVLVANFSWVEFDFPKTLVTAGKLYYLVASTVNATENWYAWGIQMANVYPNGSAFWTTNNGVNWNEEPDIDAAFMTYGTQATTLNLTIKGGIGVHVITKNAGSFNATNVKTQATITGGILKLVNISQSVELGLLGSSEVLSLDAVPLGLGSLTITATTQADNAVSVTKSAHGIILLVFVIIQ